MRTIRNITTTLALAALLLVGLVYAMGHGEEGPANVQNYDPRCTVTHRPTGMGWDRWDLIEYCP